MNGWDTAIWIAALGPVIYRAWEGWRNGVAFEMRRVVAYLFAMLLALLFWQKATVSLADSVAFAPRWSALCTFLIVFGLGYLVAGFAVRIRAVSFQSVASNPADSVLGLLAGVFSGSLLGGAAVLMLSLATPAATEAKGALGAIRDWPFTVYRFLEENVAGVSPGSPTRARFPEVAVVRNPVDENVQPNENGEVLARIEPKLIGWK